jgi:hypothetical protein
MKQFAHLKRAALVAEFTDGTRMVYAMHEPVTLEMEVEPLVDIFGPILGRPGYSQTLTVSGPFTGGRIWKDQMPGDDQPEIEPRRGEIESA